MSAEDFHGFDRFVEAARDQERDIEAERAKSRKVAWIVAGVAVAVCIGQAVAIVALSRPKPTPDPVVLIFNSATGVVEPAKPYRGDVKTTVQEQTLKADLVKYVKLRREYLYPLLQRSFGTLALMSDPQVEENLRSDWAFDNPKSPYAIYGEKGTAEVAIRSRTIIAPEVAQVRYTLTETIDGKRRTSYHVATIGYRYGDLLPAEDQRDANPVGFRVTSWKTDFEAGVRE